MDNPYLPIKSEILDVITETPTIKTFVLKPEKPFSFKAGQFVEVTVYGLGEAPFTPSSNPIEKDKIEVSIMNVGKVTAALHAMKKGERVGVRGPFGAGYPIDSFKGKEILVVGGGCGFAPLRSLMYAFFNRSGDFKKLFFRGGCKTPQELVYRNETAAWMKRKDLDLKLTVDKGDSSWDGHVGLVVSILENIDMNFREGVAIVCGPPIMMKFTTLKLLGMGFKEENLYLSMEKNMSCGIGKCGHCRLGHFYCCKDGPVFPYDKIKNFAELWE